MTRRNTHTRVVPILLALSLSTGLALAAIVSVAQAPVASAHAAYVSSVPAADSTVTQAPTVVTIHFAENLDPASSDVVVYDTKGRVVSTGKAQVDTSDPKTMTVPMAGDDAESYLVVWHNVSLDDGDPDIGAFTFYVGKVASQPTPGSSGGTDASGGSNSSSGVPGWVVALVGVAGLVVGSGATLVLAGRKGKGRV